MVILNYASTNLHGQAQDKIVLKYYDIMNEILSMNSEQIIFIWYFYETVLCTQNTARDGIT